MEIPLENTTPPKPCSRTNNQKKPSTIIKDPEKTNTANPNTNNLIVNNYVLLNLIGKGAFGEIFLSFNLRDNIEVAVKKEQKRPGKSSQLKMEAKVYQSILNINTKQDLTGSISLIQDEVQGIAKYYGMGELIDGSGYYLIMEFLGPNLNELLKYCKMKKFTISTVCLIGIQMLNRIEKLHKSNYIHRDIKPENFVIGTKENANVINLIDFGLSKKYKHSKNNQHIPYREGRNLIGTARYVSVNTHLGIEQSRRDDLESIGYVMIYFLKSFLPWQGLQGVDKYAQIMAKKLQIPTDILCSGLPEEFSTYLNYVKNLRFEDRPDYEFLRGLLLKTLSLCMNVYGLDKDNLKFDWNYKNPKTIWDIFKDKGKKLCMLNETSCADSKLNVRSNSQDSGAPKKLTVSPQQKIKKDLTKIKEDEDLEVSRTEHHVYSKTNENNPSAYEDDDNKDDDDDNENNNVYTNSNSKIQSKIEGDLNRSKKEDIISYSAVSTKKNKTKEVESSIIESNVDVINNKLTPNNGNKSSSIKEGNEDDIESEDTIEEDFSSKKVIEQNISSQVEAMLKAFNSSRNNDSIIETYITKLCACDLKAPSKLEILNGNIPLSSNEREITESEIVEPMITNTPEYKDKNEQTKENLNEKEEYVKTTENEEIKNKISSRRSKEDVKQIKENKIEELQKNTFNKVKSKKVVVNDIPTQNLNIHFSKENLIRIKKEPINKYYVIKSDIGQGSYGKVKKVRHKRLGEERAMKIVSKSTETAQNEIDILRKISHPNIVNIFEIFEDSKKYYIITEFLDGGELFEFITNQGTFLENDAAVIIKQILQGINYLHSQYIVHRDLKPENIMLISKPNTAKKYSLKIIDFGTAIQINPGEKINKFIGTSYYIAPEVLAENYNEKCDIWSCGVIMYILLCGYPPFNGSSNIDIFHNIQYSQPLFNTEEWKDVSASAIDLIKHMLQKNPNKRYSAEMCLEHKWIKENEMDDPFGLKGYKKKYNQLKAVNKMAEFVKENKFKQAVLQFITTQFDIKQEEENLRDVFKQFDVDKTGQITKKVFLKELVKLYGEEDAKVLTNKIFGVLDLDGNGDISYNEFLTSIIDSKKFITNDRLDKAFKLFDKDGNGKLSIDEIRAVFGGDEKKWKQIIQEIDVNADGEIDFEEFKMLMTGVNGKQIFEEQTMAT